MQEIQRTETRAAKQSGVEEYENGELNRRLKIHGGNARIYGKNRRI